MDDEDRDKDRPRVETPQNITFGPHLPMYNSLVPQVLRSPNLETAFADREKERDGLPPQLHANVYRRNSFEGFQKASGREGSARRDTFNARSFGLSRQSNYLFASTARHNPWKSPTTFNVEVPLADGIATKTRRQDGDGNKVITLNINISGGPTKSSAENASMSTPSATHRAAADSLYGFGVSQAQPFGLNNQNGGKNSHRQL